MKRLQQISKKAVLTLLALILSLSPVFPFSEAIALDDSLWMNGGLTYEVEGNAVNNYQAGLSCQPGDVRYEYYKYGAPLEGVSQNDCSFPLEFGSISRNGFYVPKMATKGGAFYDRIIPVPHTMNVYRQGERADIYGTRYIEKYVGISIKKERFGVNSLEYLYRLDYSKAQNQRAKWDDGRDVIIMSGQLAVSSNGKWMIARMDSGGNIIRINLETLEVLTAYSSVGGWPNPRGNYEFAISDDGSYGVVSGGFFSGGDTTKIIDFTTCDLSVEQTGSVTPGCGVRDITPFIKGIDDSQNGKVTFPAFNIDNTQIQMNVGKDDTWKRISLIAPGEEYSKLDYLAMGDSFASGEGDTEDKYYEDGTDVAPSEELPKGEKCHISQRSYPYLLARETGISSERFKSVACAGARMVDVLNENNEGQNRYEGQFDQFESLTGRQALMSEKRKAVDNFIPGRAAQIEFVKKYKPKVVTISIGGNDLGFSDVIKSCAIYGSQCDFAGDNPSNRHKKATDVRNKMDELAKLYQAIHKASEKTKIYVLGYSKIIVKDGTCHPFFGFDEKERRFVDEAFMYMNDIIEAAAKKVGVHYLDVEDAIGKSGLCGSETPRGANGLKFGDDLAPIENMPNVRLIGAESYHPNQHGHEKIAERIASHVNYDSYSQSNFVCPQNVEAPVIPEYFADNNSSVSQTYTPYNFIQKGLYVIKEAIRIQQQMFLPGSQVTLELHSEPTTLGTYTVDGQGSVTAEASLPEDVPAGYHTVRLKGTLLSGESVEFYQSILILGPEGDRDNNGTPDSNQDCLLVPIAVTNNEGDITLKPCGEIDNPAPQEPDGNEPNPPGNNPPSNDEIAQKVEQAIWQRISNSTFYQRLSAASQQNLQQTYNQHVKPRIKTLLSQCVEKPLEVPVLQSSSFKLVLNCQYKEGAFHVGINLFIGMFHIFDTSAIIKER